MAAFLPYGGVVFPSQGSSKIVERVKHIHSDIGFTELQIEINLWLALLSSNVIKNRTAIREISFHIDGVGNNKDYYAQIHYILVGDADDNASL